MFTETDARQSITRIKRATTLREFRAVTRQALAPMPIGLLNLEIFGPEAGFVLSPELEQTVVPMLHVLQAACDKWLELFEQHQRQRKSA